MLDELIKVLDELIEAITQAIQDLETVKGMQLAIRDDYLELDAKYEALTLKLKSINAVLDNHNKRLVTLEPF